jgi:hypothetical protein
MRKIPSKLQLTKNKLDKSTQVINHKQITANKNELDKSICDI